jgi:hypothetical protein
MKKFLVNLFSNRFGIVLAAVNVCYFAGKAHSYAPRPLEMPFACANSPAVAATLLALEFVRIFVPGLSFQTRDVLAVGFAGVFVVLQWLFIAWLSETLAAKIRQTNFWKNHEIRW